MGLQSKIPPILINGVGDSDHIRETKKVIRPDPDAPIIIDDIEDLKDKERFKKWSFKELAKDKITTENPRLLKCPKLLELFTEILHYRWSGKKKKSGYIQATVNQISVGIQLTEEESNAVSLDNGSV